jgi:cytoskeletal protein CcmA (bactofilin family)
MADSKQTVIENGTEFDGTMKSDCPISLSGKLKGQVSAPALTVTPSGSVQGKVKVAALKAQGEVSGDIEAESVELSGRVSDQTVIRAKTLEVMLTQSQGGIQVTFGNCELNVGEPKARTEERAKPAEAHQQKGQGSEKNLADAVANLIK